MTNSQEASKAWLARFPALSAVGDPVWRAIAAGLRPTTLARGATTFRAGDACRNYLMVVAGTVRVQKVSESGKEIVLYRVSPGETCILTTSCLFAGETYPAEGVTESDVEAVALPIAQFEEAVAGSAGFRRFVFANFGERIAELMMLVEHIAFGRMDGRLAERLLALAPSDAPLTVTHQQLAAELGTAREVVSRLLKEFERHGWVALQRGQVSIRDRDALRDLARATIV